MPKIGIVSQARMTSTRLPGKVLMTAMGNTVLEHHLNRLAWSGIPVYIATSTNSADRAITSLAMRLGIPYHCGDEHNVLERYYECATKFELDIIIRVTSDCPLIDGHLISAGLKEYHQFGDKNVYYSNTIQRTFPRGLDFEIFSIDLLRTAYQNASEESDKEHVTPYIHQNKSGKVKMHHFIDDEDHSDLRWTLDTKDDWNLLKKLFEDHQVASLEYASILRIIDKHPELATINSHVNQKEIKS